jgi:hypothetical protein
MDGWMDGWRRRFGSVFQWRKARHGESWPFAPAGFQPYRSALAGRSLPVLTMRALHGQTGVVAQQAIREIPDFIKPRGECR